MGFEVREQPFDFSAFPGSYAFPLLGGGIAAICLGALVLGTRVSALVGLLSVALGVRALYAYGHWLLRWGVLASPLMRRSGVNLIATSGTEAPKIWLCAHIDTKSQPVPTLARSAGIILESLGLLATSFALLGLATGLAVPHVILVAIAIPTLAGAILVMSSVVGTKSPGALDNASGVATVMAAAREMRTPDVGILITDAEELALAGARAWTKRNKVEQSIVLNCDGVDDTGTMYVMYADKRPRRLMAAVTRASAATGIAHRGRRLGVGILTDSIAFADARIMTLTFSRGSWWSLARVHSSRDSLEHLRGDGIAEAATLIACTARELLTEKA